MIRPYAALAILFLAGGFTAIAQTSAPPPADSGKVLFSRGTADSSPPDAAPATPSQIGANDSLSVVPAERTALTFTAYDLDAHVIPATSELAMRAALSLRNDGAAPLNRIVLQISSTLRWQGISLAGRPLSYTSRLVETDADHTGMMNEAVVTLPQPLAPGTTLNLVTLYSGTIAASAQRLERTGAPSDQAQAADWDAITSSGVFLRGFGCVLWYPVSAQPVFFRDGDRLFQSVGALRRREASAQVHLRLAVEYQGEPPDAAFFSGHREVLRAISDNPDAPAADSTGIATAEFPPAPLGFRTLNLFVTPRPPLQAGPSADSGLILATTESESAANACASVAAQVEPLLAAWLGPQPRSPLYLIDHTGQPFEDETMLLRPLAQDNTPALAESLAHSLTHAWIHSAHPWIDEGLAEFVRLLWLDQTRGRETALSVLQQGARALAEAEAAPSDSTASANPAFSSSTTDTTPTSPQRPGLLDADSELFYRTKAAAVWWMLRGIVGDRSLQQSLQAYRSDAAADRDPQGMERAIENASHKDLHWFFDDWIYHDAGLPRLSIANVTPSQLTGRTGIPDGWLLAIEVRNDGDAAAEAPVTVRSAAATQTVRLRIAGHGSATTRVVFAGTPEQVIVNDGSVPEAGPILHSRELTLPSR